MKRKGLTIAIIMIFIFSVFCFISPSIAIQSALELPPIKWETPDKEFIGEQDLAFFHAISIEQIDLEQAMQIIEELQEETQTKISFEDVKKHGDRLIFTSPEDPSAVFDVDSKTGAILFNSGMKKYSNEGTTRELPSSKRAPYVASGYLADLGYLPKNEAEMVLERVGGLGMSAAKEGEPTEKFDKIVTVFFRRTLNNLTVQGRGSRIIIHLGERGSLVGLIRNWSEVIPQKVSKEQCKGDDRIRREIEHRLGKMAGEAEEIIVRRAELVLFDDGRGVIEPAIYVVATARYKGPERAEGAIEIPVDFYIPVLLESEGYYPFHQDAEAKWPGSEREK